jgi:hypothetical protein
MTFNEFCNQHNVTPEERPLLRDHWAFLRFRSFLEWWNGLK